ncbi:rRNA biogenesis protein rrp36 [Collariella sp. IMI 366227]|nr:rRNA biogenesis protein rrp36 [Collariella sp. IMI 366227]
MSAIKRKMPPASLLQRRVRPRYEPEPESDVEEDMSDAPSAEGAGFSGSDEEDQEISGDESGSGDEDKSEGSEEDGEEDESEDDTPQIDAAQLSFGALAKAQASLGSTKRGKQTSAAEQESEPEEGWNAEKPKYFKRVDKRSSKHAPAEVTSKKPVGRRRDFLTVTAETKKTQARDPRFMPVGHGAAVVSGGGSKIDEIKARKAYAFLDQYRESEMLELRAAIKKTRDAGEKEKLQKALLSIVKQGKTPFYLKKAEQKKRVLVGQFEGMKKKQVDKAIERRRKKVAGKEKKMLPMARRGAEDR